MKKYLLTIPALLWLFPVSAQELSWYVARSPDDLCYEVVKTRSTLGTKGYGYLGMNSIDCQGTGALPTISGEWKKHVSPHTQHCYWLFTLRETLGSKGYGYMGLAEKACDREF